MTSPINKTPEKPASTVRRKWLGLSMAALIVAGLAYALIYFFGGAEPAEVDLDSTVNAVAGTTTLETTEDAVVTTQAQAAVAEDAAVAQDVSGTWTVDTTTGTFSFAEATATFAGFRVEEELAQVGAATAVGRSPDVSGSVTIDGSMITQADIEVDLTAIVSDETRREDAIQRALNTGQNPTATFVLSEPIDIGEIPTGGVNISATATGDLTINGVTRTVQIPLEARLSGDSILIVGSTDVIFADYGIETPTAQMVLSVADEGTIELQLWLTRA